MCWFTAIPKLDLAVLKARFSRPAGHSIMSVPVGGRIIQLQADPLQVAGGEEVSTLLVYYDVTDNVDLIETSHCRAGAGDAVRGGLAAARFVWAVAAVPPDRGRRST